MNNNTTKSGSIFSTFSDGGNKTQIKLVQPQEINPEPQEMSGYNEYNNEYENIEEKEQLGAPETNIYGEEQQNNQLNEILIQQEQLSELNQPESHEEQKYLSDIAEGLQKHDEQSKREYTVTLHGHALPKEVGSSHEIDLKIPKETLKQMRETMKSDLKKTVILELELENLYVDSEIPFHITCEGCTSNKSAGSLHNVLETIFPNKKPHPNKTIFEKEPEDIKIAVDSRYYSKITPELLDTCYSKVPGKPGTVFVAVRSPITQAFIRSNNASKLGIDMSQTEVNESNTYELPENVVEIIKHKLLEKSKSFKYDNLNNFSLKLQTRSKIPIQSLISQRFVDQKTITSVMSSPINFDATVKITFLALK